MLLRRVRPLSVLVGLVLAGLMSAPAALGAQGSPPKPPAGALPVIPVAADSVEAMIPYARAYVALTALRERADAEYAEPKNKRPEALAALRAKYRGERDELLKSKGFSDATYARVTQRVSGDDAARLAFEAALAKIAAK